MFCICVYGIIRKCFIKQNGPLVAFYLSQKLESTRATWYFLIFMYTFIMIMILIYTLWNISDSILPWLSRYTQLFYYSSFSIYSHQFRWWRVALGMCPRPSHWIYSIAQMQESACWWRTEWFNKPKYLQTDVWQLVNALPKTFRYNKCKYEGLSNDSLDHFIYKKYTRTETF